MKKQLFVLGMSLVMFTAVVSQAAEKVVVIPVSSSSASNVTVERKTEYVSILGNTFTPFINYGDTVDYTTHTPTLISGWNGHGVAHNTDGVTEAFHTAVQLPQGADLLGIGASVCVDAAVPDVDHNINIALWKTDMRDGTRTKIREYDINEPACNILQAQSGLMLAEQVDNEFYAYTVKVSGLEGGSCAIFNCDDRRAILQFVRIGYQIDRIQVQ